MKEFLCEKIKSIQLGIDELSRIVRFHNTTILKEFNKLKALIQDENYKEALNLALEIAKSDDYKIVESSLFAEFQVIEVNFVWLQYILSHISCRYLD